MISPRRMVHRYSRFRRDSPARHRLCMTVEFLTATMLVFFFLAPLICR